ncbi:hypothetical protein [Thalassotalea euphylliae]|nr:hypothetical protein [Thalassotalea euphylliae]
MMSIKTLAVGTVLIIATLTSDKVGADEIKEAIDSALNHYQKGEYKDAISQLQYATSLLQQQKADNIVNIFPEPLSGWQADQAESQIAGAMMMGGGISANRRYTKDNQSIEIELMVDSPMLQTMLAMFNNPAMITMSGKRLTKINGNNAMYDQNGNNIELIFVVNNNALFTLRGRNTSKQDVEAYAKAIKIDQL